MQISFYFPTVLLLLYLFVYLFVLVEYVDLVTQLQYGAGGTMCCECWVVQDVLVFTSVLRNKCMQQLQKA